MKNIFAISMLAVMSVCSAHAELASTQYVKDGLDTKLDTRTFGSLADKDTISNADVADNAGIAVSKISGLATVATSGSYKDLKDQPTIPSIDGLATTTSVTEAKTAAETAQAAADEAKQAAAANKVVLDGLGNTYATKAEAKYTGDGKIITVANNKISADLSDYTNTAGMNSAIDAKVNDAKTTLTEAINKKYNTSDTEVTKSAFVAAGKTVGQNLDALDDAVNENREYIAKFQKTSDSINDELGTLQAESATHATRTELSEGLATKQDTSTAVKYSAAVGDGVHALTVDANGNITQHATELATAANLKTAADNATKALADAKSANDAAVAAQNTANAKQDKLTAGTNITIAADGTISAEGYTLPTASKTEKGGVKVDGTTITVSGEVASVGTIAASQVNGLGALATKDSVAYAEVTGTPTLGALASKGTITDAEVAANAGIKASKIAGLAEVATSGSYNSLSDKPTIPSITGLAKAATGLAGGTATKVTYNSEGIVTKGETLSANDIPAIPTSKVTGFDAALAAKQGTLKAGDNINIATDGTISATDTKYTAGTGVAISTSNVVSAKLYTSIGAQTDGALTPSAVSDLKSTVDGHTTTIGSHTTDIAALKSADTTLQSNIDKKQDKLTDAQLKAVNSGVTTDTVAQVNTNKTDIEGLKTKDATLQSNIDKKQDKLTEDNIVGEGSVSVSVADGKVTITGTDNDTKYTGTAPVNVNGTVISVSDATAGAKGVVQVGTNISVTSGKISVADGSTSAKGVVQLSDSAAADSSTTAATPTAVRSVVGKIPSGGAGNGTWVDIWVE